MCCRNGMSDGTIYTILTQKYAASPGLMTFPHRAEPGGNNHCSSSRKQALSLHINNDNFDKVLLMWDGGCAMRTERQHWMGWAGLSTAEKGCRKVHSTCRLILGLYRTQRGL
ncbi:hypothetical protein BDV24DRAFT_131699, partial [Aspergillus arachidicola]